MSRSNDAPLRPSWASWLVASLVMAIPLTWVGSQTMAEPLYMAGYQVTHGTAAQVGPTSKDADKGDALRSRMEKDRQPSADDVALAMTQAR